MRAGEDQSGPPVFATVDIEAGRTRQGKGNASEHIITLDCRFVCLSV